jgi:UDP-N-acetylglucosamine diphosphorylase/glucosamine-1-phosphate N-acetyltransferase
MVPAKAASDDKRWTASVARIKYPWDLLEVLPSSIELDFSLLTNKKRSLKLPKQVQHTGKHPVFIEKGANIAACFLNTTSGPIYIGASAAIQEGAMIKGPFLLGQNSIVKMGAAIYGPTVVGANCLIGGEVKRSLMFPYSNKAHHGYLGDSVIGSWCNWGAGTSNSNLKNTAGIIRVEVDGKMIPVGQKAGVFMGDHSRTAINASLNSGTIIGVSAQVGVGGLTQKKISSFQWVGGKRYRLKEAIAHIRQWKALKGEDLTEQEVQRLTLIYKNDK